MKRAALAQRVASALFFAAIAGALFVELGKAALPAVVANVKPDASTKPPVISVVSPKNNSVTAATNVFLSFSVEVGESNTARSRLFNEIYYFADWQQSRTQLQEQTYNEGSYVSGLSPTVIYNASLKAIPEGKHNITIYAKESGAYTWHEDASFILMEIFSINSSATLFFTVDTIAPTVSVLAPVDVTYAPSEVQLNFTVNEATSWMGYSLDGEENTTVNGNVALPELSVGQHTLTVYANDTVGNSAASETISFTVAEPETFPTVPIAVASAASIATVAAGILVYFRRRRRGQTN